MNSAIISPCGTYRYRLDRVVMDRPSRVVFIGVNPSTADATTDDATIRKCRGFTERWLMGGFVMVNLFAYRATDVRRLVAATDPIGPDNNDALACAINTSGTIVVPCWGSRAKLPSNLHSRIAYVRNMLARAGVPSYSLGLTSSGDPKHPLMLSYSTPLVPYN